MRRSHQTNAELVSEISLRHTAADAADLAKKTSGKIGFFARVCHPKVGSAGVLPATSFREIARKFLNCSRPRAPLRFAHVETIYALCASTTPVILPFVSHCLKPKTCARFINSPNLNVNIPLTAGKP